MSSDLPLRPLQGNFVALTLTVLALLFSAVAPQGFMPSQTVNGFSIELCSGHTNKTLAITPGHPDYALLVMVYGGTEQQDAPEPQADSSVCTYAAASGASLLTSDPTVALFNAIVAPHEPDAPRRFTVRNRINIPPATGPPVTV